MPDRPGECEKCGLRPNIEAGGIVYCDECWSGPEAEIKRLRHFCLRVHYALAGRRYDPTLMDALAREAKQAAKAEGDMVN